MVNALAVWAIELYNHLHFFVLVVMQSTISHFIQYTMLSCMCMARMHAQPRVQKALLIVVKSVATVHWDLCWLSWTSQVSGVCSGYWSSSLGVMCNQSNKHCLRPSPGVTGSRQLIPSSSNLYNNGLFSIKRWFLVAFVWYCKYIFFVKDLGTLCLIGIVNVRIFCCLMLFDYWPL